jgi:hypothetical protein
MADTIRAVRVTPNTLSREVQGETVLLQLDSGEYFGLDEIGTRIWQLIVETGDLGDVHATLLREYDVEANVLTADFERLISELATRKLIDLQPLSPRS